MSSDPKISSAYRAFGLYLRTGRRLLEDDHESDMDVERKFNPYHDPRNGQFTFAPGGSGSLRHSAAAHSRNMPSPKPSGAINQRHAPPTGSRQARSTYQPSHMLSRTHNEFLSYSSQYPASAGTINSPPYLGQDAPPYLGNDPKAKEKAIMLAKAKFKNQFITGHRNAILDAAKKYDLPAPLVASVAYTELGNDNISNDIGFSSRTVGGRHIPVGLGVTELGQRVIKNFNTPRDETSFGPYNIQVRRAAEILDYGNITRMPETARRMLIPTLRDPVAATFMLAKHLSDLRNLDFPGTAGKSLTFDQMYIVATRYRKGPEEKFNDIKRNTSHGRTYLSNWKHVSDLIK